MEFLCTLLAVKNIDKSAEFYQEILGLKVISDYGANKTLTGGIALQTLDTWIDFIHTDKIVFKNNACELYFEEDDIDKLLEKLETRADIKYVHKIKEHSWGQRVIRFYDPDNHIIEVGENIKFVAKKFSDKGMTAEQIAERMDISLQNVLNLLN